MEILIKKYKRTKYKLLFPYNDSLISIIKELEERQFDASEEPKGWTMPLSSLFTLRTLLRGNEGISWAFETSELEVKFLEDAKKHWSKLKEEKIQLEKQKERNKKLVLLKDSLKSKTEYGIDFYEHLNPDSQIKLFHHQKYTPLWLNEAKSAILIGDMGTGKTLMYILMSQLDKKLKRILVICPNSLKLTLANELDKFFIDAPYFIIGRKNNKYSLEEAKFIITNYEYFNSKGFDPKEKVAKFGLSKFDLLILDESHRIKNSKSNTYKNIKTHIIKPQKKSFRIICSTGTPIKSYSREIFTQLHLINPIEFSNQWKFEVEYCGAYKNANFGNQIFYDSRRENLDSLREKIEPYTIRIKKEEVLDLPEKIFTKILIELSTAERKLYNEIESGVANEIFGEDKVAKNPLTVLLRLREFLSQVKLVHMKELVERRMDEGSKVVFIDFFQNSINQFHGYFEDRAVIHTGKQTVEERQIAVQDFVKPFGQKDLFNGSSSTTNAGLTLVVADTMIQNTLEWSVGDNKQIQERIHRIGQKRTCNYLQPIVENTIDESIFYSLERKEKTFAKLVNGEDYVSQAQESVLSDILKELKEKYASSSRN